MKHSLLLGLSCLTSFFTHAWDMTVDQTEISPQETLVTAQVHLQPHEYVYQRAIVLSVDHPQVTLSPWHSEPQATDIYDTHKKESLIGFEHDFTLSTHALTQSDINRDNVSLHITLASTVDNNPTEKIVPLQFMQQKKLELLEKESPIKPITYSQKAEQTKQEKTSSQGFKEWAKSIQDDLLKTDSWFLKLLLALLLGILLSLTPCIYPMIPITVGVLQSQGSKSLLRNFFLSSAYTLGLATTFSLLGLLAATSGEAFGNMLGSPLFVVCIVTVLCYFAFSLFGLYNLHIPRFLQNKGSISAGGSFASIFLFGLASGTVASPCLSPGLALILTMVAALANKFLGFLLLFAFGVGVSTPLLIIGTFSGSVNLLPRAGMWMTEIQKIFGFMLFGMCFYYMNNVLPYWIIIIMLTLFSLCSGIYYLRSIGAHDTPVWRNIKTVLGVCGIALSVYLAVESFQEIYYPALDDGVEATWYTDYDKAVKDAKEQNKKLFLDFWAPYCSICKLIAKSTLKNPAVAKALSEDYIVVSINGNDSNLEPFKTLKERYGIQGFPNLLIVDPQDGKELHRWRGEIEDEDNAEVVKELKKHSTE